MQAPRAARDWLDTDGRVGIELRCAFCKYNLHTLPAESMCPECGQPITASRPLAAYPPEVLQKLSRALWWVFLAMVLACGRPVATRIANAQGFPKFTCPALGETVRTPLSWQDVTAACEQLLLVPLGLALWALGAEARRVVGPTRSVRVLRHAIWVSALGVLLPLLSRIAGIGCFFDVLFFFVQPLYAALGLVVGWGGLAVLLQLAQRVPKRRAVMTTRVLLGLWLLLGGTRLSLSTWWSVRWLGDFPFAFEVPADTPAGAAWNSWSAPTSAPSDSHYIIVFRDRSMTRTTTAPAAYLARPAGQWTPIDDVSLLAWRGSGWALPAWWLLATGVTFLLHRRLARGVRRGF